MKYCSKCGKENSDDAQYCCDCGTTFVRIVEDRNPLYRIECEYCHCVFEYRHENLGFRLWYPHGFVYCPKCNKPLRHKTEYEVK